MGYKKMFTRDYTVQYGNAIMYITTMRVSFPLPAYTKKHIIMPENRNEVFCIEEEEEKRFVNALAEHFTDDKNKFRKFVELFYKAGEDYVNFSKNTSLMQLHKMENKQLKKLYQDYFKKLIDYTSILFAGFLLNDYWTEHGNRLLKTDDDLVKEALFRPVKKSTVLLMQEKAAGIKGNKKAKQEFLHEYEWISCLDLHNKPWTMKEVDDYVENIRAGEAFERLSFEEAAKKAGLS